MEFRVSRIFDLFTLFQIMAKCLGLFHFNPFGPFNWTSIQKYKFGYRANIGVTSDVPDNTYSGVVATLNKPELPSEPDNQRNQQIDPFNSNQDDFPLNEFETNRPRPSESVITLQISHSGVKLGHSRIGHFQPVTVLSPETVSLHSSRARTSFAIPITPLQLSVRRSTQQPSFHPPSTTVTVRLKPTKPRGTTSQERLATLSDLSRTRSTYSASQANCWSRDHPLTATSSHNTFTRLQSARNGQRPFTLKPLRNSVTPLLYERQSRYAFPRVTSQSLFLPNPPMGNYSSRSSRPVQPLFDFVPLEASSTTLPMARWRNKEMENRYFLRHFCRNIAGNYDCLLDHHFQNYKPDITHFYGINFGVNVDRRVA